MYATQRTVDRHFGIKKSKEPKHSQRKTGRGCEYRVQVIKDEHGFVTKRIIHYSESKLAKIAKYNKLLEEYRAAQEAAYKAAQEEGENDVTGAKLMPLETPDETVVTATE